MGKIVALREPALGWARARFARYYAARPVPAPSALAYRELAAFPFAEGTMMRRHTSVADAGALAGFLAELVPRHVYYSAAYYAHPGHPSMAAKDWLGADLIFDLDADHLKGSESVDYAGQLDLVKRQLLRLYDDFLLGDLGVDPRETAIVFSGGRGYHVHVREERFRGLSSNERRELVDYVSGAGVDIAGMIDEVRHLDPATQRTKAMRHLAPPEAPGWRGRTTRGLFELLDRWAAAGPETAAAELAAAGLEPKRAKETARLLADRDAVARLREGLNLEALTKTVPTEVFEAVLQRAAVAMQGETDAPVTTDIHRLIRLPGSLHGGTGFRVVPLDRDRVEPFEPFRDALLPANGAGRVRVELTAAVRYPFDPPVAGVAGDVVELAEPAALFLLLRGEAALRP
jgi:DNA primase small subunit